MNTEMISIEPFISLLTCPLSKKIFRNPIIADDECVYETYELYKYVKENNNNSPLTKKPIKEYYSIFPLKYFIDELEKINKYIENNRYIYYSNLKIHYMYQKDIDSLFASNNLDQIFQYTEFDLKIIFGNIKYLIENSKSDINVIKYLIYIITNSVNKNVIIFDNKFTIFNYICCNGCSELICATMDIHGIDLENPCENDWRPIHQIACNADGISLLKLIKKGVQLPDDILHYISGNQDAETITTILEDNSIIISSTIINFEECIKNNSKIKPEQYSELIRQFNKKNIKN